VGSPNLKVCEPNGQKLLAGTVLINGSRFLSLRLNFINSQFIHQLVALLQGAVHKRRKIEERNATTLSQSTVSKNNNEKMHNCQVTFLTTQNKVKYTDPTLIINQQMQYIKFRIKTLKIVPTRFDPKIILRELRCSLLKSF
jgi:hypothetical protein